MLRRICVALALAVLVALAGCAGREETGAEGEPPEQLRIEAVHEDEDISETDEGETDVTTMQVQVGETTFTATLANTEAAAALAERLASGLVVVTLSEYGGFEHVGPLPWGLPTSDTHVDTVPGDIMLFQGNQMTIFHGTNSWSYTQLGHIDATADELASAFSGSEVTVTLSL